MQAGRAMRVVGALLVPVAILFAAGSQWVWPHSVGGFWVSTLLEIVGPMLGGVVAIRRGLQLSGNARQTWVLLGSGACAWSVGMVAFAWYEVILDTPAPFPGLPDVGYLAAVALLALGVWRFPTQPQRRWTFARMGIETWLVMISTFLVAWVVSIGRVFALSSAGWLSEAVSLAYPCGDLLVFAMVLLLLRRSPVGGRGPLFVLMAGMLLLLIADTAFALMSANGTYYTGSWVDPGWWAGLASVGVAAHLYPDVVGPQIEEPPSRREVVIPYLVALLGAVAITVHWSIGNGPTLVEVVLLGAIVLLVVARQSVMTRDSVDLSLELQHHAYHDELTGLPNRRSLFELLASQTERGARVSAVLLLDLDGFNEVNDTLGHATGDEALREIAARLKETVRGADVVARLGGDEFAVVVFEGGDASATSERLLARLREPLVLDGTPVVLTASIGIAPAPPDANWDDLLRNADLAMYQAKGTGRDRAFVYRTALHERARRRLDRQAALREAVDNQEFRVLYQPIVDLPTWRMSGVEALIRWPRHGRMVPPDEFLPMLEASGLIVPLGDWILDQACSDLAAWQAAGHPEMHVAVNVAYRQLCDPCFADRVAATLARRGIPAAQLTVEITEDVILDDEQTEGGVRAVLDRIAALGVRLALDDFGTGYASLSTLRTLPVTTIKVDKSFIAELEFGSSPTVDGIAYLAHRYGLTVVAEGVETVRQLDRLRPTGIGYIQGYLYAPPLEASDISSRLHVQSTAPPRLPRGHPQRRQSPAPLSG